MKGRKPSKEEIRKTTLYLNPNIVEQLKEKGYNISKLVRTLLKKKLEQEK